MTAVSVLPVAGDVLFDARNDGRSLRVNWHPVDDLCVLSMWRAGRCVATFQLPRSQTPALINSLVNGLAQERPASQPEPAQPEPAQPEPAQPEPAQPTPQPWTEPQLTSVPVGRTSMTRRLRATVSRRLNAWRPDRGER